MGRIIAKALIFFILFANGAWAVDVHEAEQTSSPAHHQVASGHSEFDESPSHRHEHNDASCDHCCHATAHYVGCPPASLAVPAMKRPTSPALPLAAYRSRATEPPLPPPNI